MSPIKDLTLVYSDPNIDGTFSEGDAVEGTVSFGLTRETKVRNIQVKLKGEARVKFDIGLGDSRIVCTEHKTYFKIKTLLLEQNNEGKFFLFFGFFYSIIQTMSILQQIFIIILLVFAFCLQAQCFQVASKALVLKF